MATLPASHCNGNRGNVDTVLNYIADGDTGKNDLLIGMFVIEHCPQPCPPRAVPSLLFSTPLSRCRPRAFTHAVHALLLLKGVSRVVRIADSRSCSMSVSSGRGRDGHHRTFPTRLSVSLERESLSLLSLSDIVSVSSVSVSSSICFGWSW